MWPSSWAVLIAIPPTTPIVNARPMLSKARESAVCPEPAGEDQPGVLDRDEEVGAPAVVAVLLEPLEDASRAGCVASIPIAMSSSGKTTKTSERAEEPEAAEAGGFDRGPGENGARGTGSAEQPGIALGVAPGRRVEFDASSVGVSLRSACVAASIATSSLSKDPGYVFFVYKIAPFVKTVTAFCPL